MAFLASGCWRAEDRGSETKAPLVIGDAPAVPFHMKLSDIEAGIYRLEEIRMHGELLFVAVFNSLDGAGRPSMAGGGEPREPRTFPENMNRISGPDADSCAGCHNRPMPGGGGDNVANVFVLAQLEDFVDFLNEDQQEKGLAGIGNERNTLGMSGSGFIELLAREMTVDLQRQRDEARARAIQTGRRVDVELVTKGVSFGTLHVTSFGAIGYEDVTGVDRDLVVRPFHQKGVVESLRVFTNGAMNHHHGMQATELFGVNVDADGDGVINELTAGDMTAIAVFQAMLPPPVQIWPEDPAARAAAEWGETLFSSIGCSACHIPALPLEGAVFTEPGPFNREPHLRSQEVGRVLEVDLSPIAQDFKRDEQGRILVPVFTDLKRHDMGEVLNNETIKHAGVPTNQWLTRKLWGFFSEPPFLHTGRATLISEAIIAHGGEAKESRSKFQSLSADDQAALVEFLKTFQIPRDE